MEGNLFSHKREPEKENPFGMVETGREELFAPGSCHSNSRTDYCSVPLFVYYYCQLAQREFAIGRVH